jgi:hypothetical protein
VNVEVVMFYFMFEFDFAFCRNYVVVLCESKKQVGEEDGGVGFL